MAIFAVGRALDAVLFVALIARHGPTRGGSGGYFQAVTTADGGWYRIIAADGYPGSIHTQADGHTIQNPWAFYPLYPATVRVAESVCGLSFAVAASVVSMLCGAAAFGLLSSWLAGRRGRPVAVMAVVALSAFPAAPAFQMAYTESLALLLVVAVLIATDQDRHGRAGAGVVLLSLTRPIVIALAPVFIARWWLRRRRGDESKSPARPLVLLAALSVLSFGLWPLVCAVVTGRIDGYSATQRSWLGGDGHAQWRSWLVRAVEGPDALPCLLVLVLVLGPILWTLTRGDASGWPASLRWWAACYPLFLAGTTRPTSSIVRYLMLGIVTWWPVTTAISSRIRVGIGAVVLVLLGLLTQAWWIDTFVLASPGSIIFP